jgi:hypothetical protein
MGALTSQLETITSAMSDTFTETFAKSKMYLAGAEAAAGLAKGLKDNAALVDAAYASVLPSGNASLALPGSGVGAATPGNTTIVNVAEGAIPITTPTKDPALVAAKVIDEFAGFSNF